MDSGSDKTLGQICNFRLMAKIRILNDGGIDRLAFGVACGRLAFQGKVEKLRLDLESVRNAHGLLLRDVRDTKAGGRTILVSAIRGNQV